MTDHYGHNARVIYIILIKNVTDISISDEVKALMKSILHKYILLEAATLTSHGKS